MTKAKQRGLGWWLGSGLGALVLAVLFLGDPLWAWFRYPALSERELRAAAASVLRQSAVPAFDAQGNPVTFTPTRRDTAEAGPCLRLYGWTRWGFVGREDRRREGGGTATFDCLLRIEAEGHGPLRAVFRQVLSTNPAYHVGPRALPHAEARAILARLPAP